LLFLGEEDSADSPAKRDQIDVGLSGPLQTGFACSILSMPSPLGLPCGRLALEPPRRDNSKRLFHVPDLSRGGLGPLCTPAVRHSRRATLESPNLTAYLLVQALISLVWLVLCDDACECSHVLTIPSDSSVAPD